MGDSEKKKDMAEFSVVIPVFNEVGSLVLLQKRLNKVMEKVSSNHEIIYVDDNSTDFSLEILKRLRKKYPKMKIVTFNTHKGKSEALLAGFKVAKGKWIITLDADLQNPPEEILKLLEFKNHFDFITGIRENRKDGFLKKVSSKVAMFFRWVILGDITKDIGCSLRMFRRVIIDTICFSRNFHRFFTFLVRMEGFSIKEVYIRHSARKFGKSKYGIFKRAQDGLIDLLRIFWQKKRCINYRIKNKS